MWPRKPSNRYNHFSFFFMELLILEGYTKHFPYTNLELLLTRIWNLNLKPKLNELNLNIENLKTLFLKKIKLKFEILCLQTQYKKTQCFKLIINSIGYIAYSFCIFSTKLNDHGYQPFSDNDLCKTQYY